MSPDETAVADDRWHLEDERDFLVRSLADAEREHQAGDMGDEDFEALSRRDRERLEAVDAALRRLDVAAAVSGERTSPRAVLPGSPDAGAAPGSSGTTAASPRRRWRWRRNRWMAIIGVAAIVAGVVLPVHLTSTRLPGQEITGGQDLGSQAQVQKELGQAADEENSNNLVEAIKLYNAILATDPNQPEALAEKKGWLEYEGGEAAGTKSLMRNGAASIEKAMALAPKDYAPHLYLGTIDLQQDATTSAAVTQYQTFLRLGPPKKVVRQAAPYIRQAFTKAGVPVPAAVS